MRYVRNRIVDSEGSEIAKQRQLERHKKNLFLVDASRRLVKVAKTAMILNGDGHAGMTAGDSLGSYESFDKTIVSQAGRCVPTVILTNPPFAGVGDGRITHEEVLRRFDSGKRWVDVDGEYRKTEEFAPDGVPPELLFFERCVDWLKPGGKLGIVLPKSFLDTQTYRPGRAILFARCRLLAIINCHKNTFQPFTGVRTCIVVVQKLAEGESAPSNYPIFMAISRKIGQDSEGVPIYKKDAHNNPTDELDDDLAEIGKAFDDFRQGKLKSSGYFFAVDRSKIEKNLNINPQLFLPHLNETLESIQGLDGADGWSVSTIGAMSTGIKIFKGPRFKSESIIVDEPGPNVEPYLTPSAVLQEKGDSAKLIDVSKASLNQLRMIAAIRVRRGDIVITRSGTIGRVAYITRRLHNVIVSDDLIRVRVEDEELRFYIFAYLQSKYAQDQMSRNEYGAVQQHLEPEHIRNILVPVADNRSHMADIVDGVRLSIELRERLEAENGNTSAKMDGLIKAALEGI